MSQSSDINILSNKLYDYQLGLCSLTELVDFIYQMNDNSNMNDDEIPQLDNLTELIQISNKVKNKELNITQLIKAVRGYKKYLDSIDYKNNQDIISDDIDLSVNINDKSHQALRNTAKLAKNDEISSETYFDHLQQHYKAIIDELKSSNMKLDDSTYIISFNDMKEIYYSWVDNKISDSEYFQLINTFLNPPAIVNNDSNIVNKDDSILDINIGDQIQLIPGAVDRVSREIYRVNEMYTEGSSGFLTIYDIKEINGLQTICAGIDGVTFVNIDQSNVGKVIYSPENLTPQSESITLSVDESGTTGVLTNFINILKDYKSDNPTHTLTDLVQAAQALKDYMKNKSEISDDETGVQYSSDLEYNTLYPYAPFNKDSTEWNDGVRSIPYIHERKSNLTNAEAVYPGSEYYPNGNIFDQGLNNNYGIRYIEKN